MLKINNIKIYSDIRSLPAWNYFHFQMYSQLFEACTPITAQSLYNNYDEIITRLRFITEAPDWKDRVEDLMTHLENSKVAYFQILEGVSPFYFAFGCLIAERYDANTAKWESCRVNLLSEEDLLNEVFAIHSLSANQIIEEVRKANDSIKAQLNTYFPTLFPDRTLENSLEDFEVIKNGLLSIDLEQDSEAEIAKTSLWEIEKHFIGKLTSIPINPSDPEYFGKKYIITFTEFAEALGLSESDLKEMSIYTLFIKQQYQQRKAQKQNEYGKESIDQ